MENRLSRIINPKTGRTVMLAVDHGYFLGPTTKLEAPGKTISPLLPYADAVMLTRGVLRTSVDPGVNKPVVLRISGGTSILKELSNEGITTSLKDAVRLNASAVALSIFVGSEYEKQTLMNLSRVVEEAQDFNMPVLAVTAVGKEMARDARYLGLACRIAAELGANFVKTYYCEDFSKVVEGCPVPLVIAGGKKTTEMDALELANNALNEGAVGVDMGRNIWQSDYPIPMIRAVRSVVQEGASPKEAFDLYNEIKAGKEE
jgi:putative autoinducer-2 (AI-2) aldolase